MAALAGAAAFYFLADAARLHLRRGHGGACSAAPRRGRLARWLAAPALTTGRHTVMALAMAVMLAPLI